MKLSDLIAYRTMLNNLSAPNIQREANMKLDIITHLVDTRESIGEFSQQLKDNQAVINRSFNSFEGTVQNLKNEINRLIEIEQPHWFQESYRLYEEEELVYPTTESLLNRRMNITDETRTFLNARVKMYNSWKYPGMIIRPGLENFINDRNVTLLKYYQGLSFIPYLRDQNNQNIFMHDCSRCKYTNDIICFRTFNGENLVWKVFFEFFTELGKHIKDKMPIQIGFFTCFFTVCLVEWEEFFTPVFTAIRTQHHFTIFFTEIL